jgi:hypothetical protein
MARELSWVTLGVTIKDTFHSNIEFGYITIDGDGSVCAWSERPEYDAEKEIWHGEDWFIVGMLKDPPEGKLIDYSEAIYERSLYDWDFNYDESPKIEGFNAAELSRASNKRIKDIIFTNIKDRAYAAVSSGQFSTFCWVGWVPKEQRDKKVEEAAEDLKQRGFIVTYDETQEHLIIEW